jgi:hypothetical protein
MKVDTLIKASWFYIDESEKTKENWFLYESACKFYEFIESSKTETLRKWKAQRSDKQIAEFCAYFAKRMRPSILRSYYDDIDEDLLYKIYIRDYCHGNSHGENIAIMETCDAAMIELLESCVICPVRCLDDIDARCELFDRVERGGYLS